MEDALHCDHCGVALELGEGRLHRKLELVRVPRAERETFTTAIGEAAGPGAAVVGRHSPRYAQVQLNDRLCAACHAEALEDDAAEEGYHRKATLRLALVALLIGLVSLFGPPFWPVVYRWLHGQSDVERAMTRIMDAPTAPYKTPRPLAPVANETGAAPR